MSCYSLFIHNFIIISFFLFLIESNARIVIVFFFFFSGDKKSEKDKKSHVRWEIVADRANEFEEPTCSESIASFPNESLESDQYVTNITIEGDNVYVTRASVYLNNDDEPICRRNKSYEKLSIDLIEENSYSKLLDTEMATINFSESENSVDEFSDEAFNSSPQAENLPKILTSPSSIPQETSFSNVNNKMCYGPDINLPPSRGMPNLPMFVRDVETELNSLSVSQSQSHWPNPKENKFESNNSLDIEKELNDLIGTLRIDIEAEGNANIQTEHVDDDNYNFPVSRGSTASEDIKDGSRFNLAFIDTECESDKKDSSDYVATCSLNQIPVINSEEYWKNQRIKSKSFADRYKLGKMLKRGKQRMSMIEYGSKIKGCQISEPDDVRLYSTANGDRDNDNSNVLGLAYDRSSVVDPVVSSSISLPIRPRSEPDDSRRCIYPSQSCVGKHLNQCSPSNNSGKRTESFSNQANTR